MRVRKPGQLAYRPETRTVGTHLNNETVTLG
jgi:hypothetical protein